MLNEAQKQAVMSDSDKICCVAGAGTGKTTVMLKRIERIVEENKCPDNILVLTFTNAAAFEMSERYKSNTNTNHIPEFRTFHAFCYHILARNIDIAKKLGYSKVPDIALPADEKRIKAESMIATGIKMSSKKLNGLVEPANMKEANNLETINLYTERQLRRQNLITFDKLSSSICKLFTDNDELILKYKEQYKYIFVDEFQDTDETQWNFVKSFKSSKIFVCGDALQNIYSFRGTTNEIIKSLTTNPEWETIKLSTNYRSDISVVKYANKFSKTYAADSYRVNMDAKDNASLGIVKERKSSTCYYAEPVCVRSLKNIVDCINSSDAEKIAVLCRTNAEVANVTEYLKTNNIEISDNSSMYDVHEVLNAVFDNEYFADWLASKLDAQNYSTYTQFYYLDSETKRLDILMERFKHIPSIIQRASIVLKLRRILNDKTKSLTSRVISVLSELGLELDEAQDIKDEQSAKQLLLNLPDNREKTRVYVGTIHSVKGLEFDEVHLIGVNSKSFKLNTEDNKNLFYVGVTRAKHSLWVYKEEI